ncbi:MAG: hypothetical protein ACU826_09195 [Gammaproteobacteria bacterium]
MDHREVAVEPLIYRFASDEMKLPGEDIWTLVSARLVDESTDQPLALNLHAAGDRDGLIERVAGSGLVGLIGSPEKLFRNPALDANAHAIRVEFSAAGYLPMSRDVLIGPIPGFPQTVPDGLLPRDLGDIALHRQAVAVRGRVMRHGVVPTPAAGATVSVTDIMRKVTAATASPVPDPFAPLSVTPGIRVGRSAGVHCRVRPMAPSAATEKSVLGTVSAGSTRIPLSNVESLAPGDVVEVDFDRPPQKEFLTVKRIFPSGTDTSPGTVEFDYPAAQSHRKNARLRIVSPQAVTADHTLGVAAIAGDRCLLLDDVTGFSDGDVIEIADGIHAVEYQAVSLFAVTADPEGYYRLPLFNRIGQMNLRAELGLQSLDVENYVPDYGERENIVDIIIK